MPFSSANPTTELFLPGPAEEKGIGSSTQLQLDVLHLFDLLRNPLLRYAISFGISVHDGEDVLQEVFLALFRHLQQDRSRENLRGWLFRVTHHQALKRRAANRTAVIVSPISEDHNLDYCDPAPDPEEQLLFTERQQRLLAVMQALPATDQMCLRLRAQGCRYREISGMLGISLGSVSNSLARSLAKLERMDNR